MKIFLTPELIEAVATTMEAATDAECEESIDLMFVATALRTLQAEKELWRKSVSESAGIHFTQHHRIAALQAEVEGLKADLEREAPTQAELNFHARRNATLQAEVERLGKLDADAEAQTNELLKALGRALGYNSDNPLMRHVQTFVRQRGRLKTENATLQAKLDKAVHALREMHSVESYNDELTCAALSCLDAAPDGDCQHCKGEGCVACDARCLPKKPCSECDLMHPFRCEKCGKPGSVALTGGLCSCDGHLVQESPVPCPKCQPQEPCSECGGSGRFLQRVKGPRGLEDTRMAPCPKCQPSKEEGDED